uniref:RNA polymerase sigma factor n=1 Tax=Labilibacter marinus TaxID=1477105 RepID=UPI000832D13D
KSLGNFRGDSSMSTWIYRIAVNTSLTYTGKAFKQMQLIVNTDTQNLGMMYEDDKEASQLKEEQFEKLQSELNMLSVIDKALMSLMLEGLSMKDISDVIGISEANVKVKIYRIKAQLKQNLSK